MCVFEGLDRGQVYLGNSGQRNLVVQEVIAGDAQLLDLLRGKSMGPALGGVAVVIRMPDGGTLDLLGELLKGNEVVIEGGMLAGGLEPIGEDVEGDGAGLLCEGGHIRILERGPVQKG